MNLVQVVPGRKDIGACVGRNYEDGDTAGVEVGFDILECVEKLGPDSGVEGVDGGAVKLKVRDARRWE